MSVTMAVTKDAVPSAEDLVYQMLTTVKSARPVRKM